MAWNPAFRLIRPDDQVVLDIRVTGIEGKVTPPPPGGGPTARFEKVGSGPREIWVQFGPQQIIEYAQPEGGVRADQDNPLFVPRADLVFTVPDALIPFPCTVEGLLDVLRRSSLKSTAGDPEVAAVTTPQRSGVDPHQLVAAGSAAAVTDRAGGEQRNRRHDAREAETAARRPPVTRAETVTPGGSAGPLDTAEAPAPADHLVAADPGSAPGPVGTQPANSLVPMPRRLAVRPPRGAVRMTHPVALPTHADRTELWATRLAVAGTDPAAPPVELELDVALTLLPPGPLTGPRAENLIRNALFDADTADIGPKTQPPYQDANGNSTGRFPARLGRLMLSTLGGWLRLAGTWPTGAVRRLRVDTAQGRDQFQRLVVAGRLLPFGHKALLTSTTTRQFETGSTRVAGLQTRTVLQIVEPLVTIDPADGVHAGWPFSTVEIRHPEPIVGAQGFDPGANLSTFEVGGLPFQFQCRGIDRSGQPIDFQLTMLFARDPVAGTPDVAAEFTAWRTYTKADHPAPPAGTTDTRRTSYFRSELGGQRLGVAVPPSADTLRAEQLSADPLISPNATTVLARRIELAIDATHKPVMKELVARVEAVERFVPGSTEVVLTYAKPYLDSLLDGANAQGQVFLQFAKNAGSTLAQPLVGLAGPATAGMAQVSLPIAALSRRFGAVAGELKPDLPNVPAADQVAATTLKALSAGELDLRFLSSSLGGLSSKLLGLVDLGKLIPLNPKPKLADSQQITTDVLDGVIRQTLIWNVPLLERTGTPPNVTVKPLRQGFISLEAQPPDPDLPPPDEARKFPPIMTIVQQTTADAAAAEMRSTTTCTLTGLVLLVYMSDDEDDPDNVPIVTIPFKKISFVTKDGGKPDFDVVLGRIEFGGILQFVRILADLIDELGLSDPPALEVTSTGVRSSFSFDVPAVAIGMFSLQNIGFSTVLNLTFQPTDTQPALVLMVGFASRANPFLLTVAFLGGGGYLEIAAASDGLARIEGSLQFGAALVVTFAGVAKGSVEAMGGVIFVYDRPNKITRLTAFLRVRGEVSVLSLITVSVTMELQLSYDFRTEILSGRAEVVVVVSVWFFSQSVAIPYDWEAKTGNDDPTFAELMAPAGITGETPWDTYCMAFAA